MARKLYTLDVFGDKDEITIQELYDFFGIDADNKPQAEVWMHNRVYYWQARGLTLNVYETINNKECITKIRLTEEGKEELGRGGKVDSSFYDLVGLASQWVKDNPERRVTFEFEPFREQGKIIGEASSYRPQHFLLKPAKFLYHSHSCLLYYSCPTFSFIQAASASSSACKALSRVAYTMRPSQTIPPLSKARMKERL